MPTNKLKPSPRADAAKVTLFDKIKSLNEKQRAALDKVRGEYNGVYLDLEMQNTLASLGLIELKPGRKSAVQKERFAITLDALATLTGEAQNAIRAVELSELEDPDFEEKVRLGYYEQNDNRTDFAEDAETWLTENGVPKQYASKCVSHAYESGHSSGFSEILNYLYDLIEIFEASK